MPGEDVQELRLWRSRVQRSVKGEGLRDSRGYACSRVVCVQRVCDTHNQQGDRAPQQIKRKGGMMRLVVTYAVLVCVFVIPDGAEWLLGQGRVVRMLLHHFFHGNVFHLLVNCLSLYFILPRAKGWHLAAGYVIGSLSLLATATPVIGASNLIYAVVGVRSPSFDSWWWRHPGTRTFLIVTALMILLPNVSAMTHIASFLVGVLVSMSVRWFRKISNDSARYI